jgi:uncharacterized protein
VAIRITPTHSGVQFHVRVQPRAANEALCGEWNGALKVRLTAPPAEGRANEALCRFLASQLNVPPRAVKILSGERSRTKLVEVSGVAARRIQGLAGTNA